MRFLSTLIASTLGTLVALGVIGLFFMLFIFALVASTDTAPRVESGSVLVIELDGGIPEIAPDDPLAEAFMGEARYDLRDLIGTLEKAAVDERVEGVWLQVHSVGASWATLQEVREALERYKLSGKPLIASADEYAMNEAGYYLASTADAVYAAPEGLFEFNGFYISAEFYKELLDKLEIDAQVVRAGVYKGAVEPYLRTDLSPENEAQLQAIIDAQNTVFMRDVATSRGLASESLMDLASNNALFTTAGALEAGLIDGLLYHDQVVEVFKERLDVDADDDLLTTPLRRYAKVSPTEAGLEIGDEGEIAVVYAVGAIMPGESGYNANPLMGGQTVGPATFNRAIAQARDDEDVKAVVVRIDSPGGFAPAADAMLREIRLTADVKPVLISMGGVAASGGYWMAMGGDTIVADPLTITGSIGVFSMFLDLGDFFSEKLGITYDFVTTSPYADMFSGIQPLSEAEKNLLERSTEATYLHFLEVVAENRNLTPEAVDAVAQGRVWTGMDALEVGLVDVLGGLDTTIELAAERAGLEAGSYRIRTLPRPKTVLEQFNEALQTRAAGIYMGLRYTPAEQTLLEQARLLEQVKALNGTVQAWMPMRFTIR